MSSFSSTGITVFFVMVAMSFPAFKLTDTADKMKWFFLVFPHYALSSSLYNLNQITTMDRVCTKRCEQIPMCTRDIVCAFVKECCGMYSLRSLISIFFLKPLDEMNFFCFSSIVTTKYAWKEPGIGRNLIYMVVTGIVCFVILLIIEYRLFEGISYYISSFFERDLPLPSSQNEIDSDVDVEKKRVKQMTMVDLEANNLVLQSLSKYYGKFLAVNQISIGIQRYILQKFR